MMRQLSQRSVRSQVPSTQVTPYTRNQSRPRVVRARALQSPDVKPAIAEFADSIGLPTDEGLFGFKPFSEVWCGRLAMMGFVSSIAVELQTGKGTLQQLGISTPSTGLLLGLLTFVGVGTLVGAGYTAFLGASGKLSSRDVERYRSFLLLDKEDEVEQSLRSKPTAADKFLAVDNDEEAINAARQVTSQAASSTSLDNADLVEVPMSRATSAAAPTYEDIYFSSSELQYARTVETDNGRAAMLGFLVAVLVEAATGKGIILQLIMWFKIVGLLGPASGF